MRIELCRSLQACWQSVLLFSVALVSGCGPHPEIAAVRGKVSQEGEPLEGVIVTFLPDPQQEVPGAISTAVTDQRGEYELIYRGDASHSRKGALIGHHRVTLKDFAAENVRDDSRPPDHRIPQSYRTANQTPLAYEISGRFQTINIDIPRPEDPRP